MATLKRYRSVVFDSARWEGFAFRDGDILITTPPKSGTTWMQMICALLVIQDPVRVNSIDALSPWLDMQTRSLEEVVALLAAQEHRRFIKTHTPLDGLPWDDRVTYISVGRDPRDAAISFANHADNVDMETFLALRAQAVGTDDLAEVMRNGPPAVPDSPVERFWAWADAADEPEGPSTLARMLHHHSLFWEIRDRPNVVLMHYADLSADLAGQMRGLADRLGIAVPEDLWPGLVAAARFEAMKARADTLAPSNAVWRSKERFFHRGTSGQWHDLLDEADRKRYAERVAAMAEPDVLDWVHAGSTWRD